MAINIPNVPTFLESMQQGANIGGGIMQGFLNKKRLEQEALANELMNKYRMGQLDIERQKLPHDIALQQAHTRLYNIQSDPRLLEADIEAKRAHSNLYKMQSDPRLLEADIEAKRALSKQREMSLSGGIGGVGQKEEMFFQSLVAKDNPQLGNDPTKVYEASNVLRQGGTMLSDGTPLNPLSHASRASFDRITRGTTTSPLITQGVVAKQAESEMKVADKYIREGVSPYGTTIFGISPKQMEDVARPNDHAAQVRLGKYLASQQLLYDRAALTLRINSLPAGVKIADEIKNLSYQTINDKFPWMTDTARKVAAETTAKALSEMLEARKKIPIGASHQAQVKNEDTSHEKVKPTISWKVVNGELVQG
jgi:hypothetical protein